MGNFVNRGLTFISKFFDGAIPSTEDDPIEEDGTTSVHTELIAKVCGGRPVPAWRSAARRCTIRR